MADVPFAAALGGGDGACTRQQYYLKASPPQALQGEVRGEVKGGNGLGVLEAMGLVVGGVVCVAGGQVAVAGFSCSWGWLL
jgi:hypothetical protein